MLENIKSAAKALRIHLLYFKLLDIVLKWQGFELVTLPDTVTLMEPYKLLVSPANHTALPQVNNCSAGAGIVFTTKEAVTIPVYVWNYHKPGHKVTQSMFGSVILERKVLCTDRNHMSFYKGLKIKNTRATRQVDTLIAPFSQMADDIIYGGYYDFVFLVLTKLCRIKDAVPAGLFKNAVISYPLFKGSYEADYMQLLDVNMENVLNSYDHNIIADRVITGNSASWFYPNIADIEAIKRHIMAKVSIVKTENNRVYIQRACRRRVLNEEELLEMLKEFNFIIIEDKKRTIAEQVQIYQNASFILGPHGASFTNVIWCAPGTYLFELFSPNYVPDFFLYLCKITGMDYSAYYDGPPTGGTTFNYGLTDDITVNVPALRKCLKGILKDS